MASVINQSSGQGALFELVARGNKDHYFVRDNKSSTLPYDGHYESSCHHLAERRTIVPLNQTKFGSTFEVEIDAYGDVMTECAFEIDLPSWIPPLPLKQDGEQCSAERVNKLSWIRAIDASGTSYGYVNYIGFLLFERIQFYQDQFLIQEWSGDGLLTKMLTEGSWNSSYLEQLVGGLTLPNDPRSVALRATPGHLRIKLPLPGLQCPKDGGFPFIAAQHQTFRIKATLRKLEDLVVSTSELPQKPTPWNVSQFQYTGMDGSTLQFAPIPFLDIGQPTILLSTVQHYVPSDAQAELRAAVISIPFRRQFENIFTFADLDYKPIDAGGTALVTRRLDGRHPTERIFFFFRNQTAVMRNRLDDFYNDLNVLGGGQFYNEMKLVIAGRDREDFRESFVWDSINAFCKDERDSGLNIGSMKWSLGEQYGTIYPAPRQPEGTVNFTTADRPTLHIELTNILPGFYSGQRQSEMKVFTEGWAIYEFREGRSRLLFGN